MKTNLIMVGLCIALTSCTEPYAGGWGYQPFGQPLGQGAPWGFQGALAANRSIPPQVKNNWARALNPYQAAGNPWQSELNYWRSMPPEVRNAMAKQQQQRSYASRQPEMIYIPPPAH
jgi:hypothetical protein